MIDKEMLKKVLGELVRFEIAASDYARAIGPERSRENAKLAIQREQAYQDTLREALFLRNREVARAPIRDAAKRLGVTILQDTDDWLELASEATRVLYDLSKERARRDQGVFAHPSPYFQTALASISLDSSTTAQTHFAPSAEVTQKESTTLQEPVVQASTEASIPEPVQNSNQSARTSLSLAEAFEWYGQVRRDGKQARELEERADQSKGLSYERNSYPNLKATGKLLADIVGNKNVSELTTLDLTEAFTLLQKVPRTHGKSSTDTRSIRELVEATDSSEQMEKIRVLCPLKTGSFETGVFRLLSLAERGAESYESIEVHGSAKGLHPKAGRARHIGRGDLPQGWDQPGDIF